MASEDGIRPRNRPPQRAATPRASARNPARHEDTRGHSGYGIESLRPHLHDQLAMKDLLRAVAGGRTGGKRER